MMLYYLVPVVLLVVIMLWLAFKKKRSDGEYIGDQIHPYRRMMPVIMPSKNESLVFFDLKVDARKIPDFLASTPGCNLTHLLVSASAKTLYAHKKINRFIAGGRVYQRDGVWITFSMKRKKLDAKAKLATVKLRIEQEDSLADVTAKVNANIKEERSDKETYLDKELSLFLRLPHVVIIKAQRLLAWANEHHLMPLSFIKNDSLFTSVVLANLGSLKMQAAYHHLYEWGNCPLFITAGMIEPMPTVDEEGELCVRPMLPLRFTFDERVEDGLNANIAIQHFVKMLEDPAAHF